MPDGKHPMPPTSPAQVAALTRYTQVQAEALVVRAADRVGPIIGPGAPLGWDHGYTLDRLVNPHMRRLLLDLLEADVEVLDLLPVLLAARDPSPEPLYLAADPHWGPKGYNAAARVTATRLARYPFAVAAKAGPPVVKAVKTSFPPLADGIAHVAAGLMALNPSQRQRATEAHPKTYDVVTGLDGGWPRSHTSSVIVIGDSYGIYYDGALSRDLNLVLDRRASGGQTTEAFADFLREPESLAAGKVVVWIASTPQLLGFKPLPAPILAAASA